MKCIRVFPENRIHWICLMVFAMSLMSSVVQTAPATDDNENSIYTPAEESTARAVDVTDPKRPNRRQRGERIAQMMMEAGDVDRIGYPSAILDSIFQIPIQTLKAVSVLVQTILGGRRVASANVLSHTVPQAVFIPLTVPPPLPSHHLTKTLPLDNARLTVATDKLSTAENEQK